MNCIDRSWVSVSRPLIDKSVLNRGSVLAAVVVLAVSVLGQSPANAGWVVESVLQNGFTSSFVVDLDASDADGWSFQLQREGVYADSGIGSIPISFDFQAPQLPGLFDRYKYGPDVSAGGRIENNDIPNGFTDHAEAYVIGAILPGHAYGAAWAYELELILDPGKMVTFTLNGNNPLVASANDLSDIGFAVAGIKLFSSDLDLDAPGGANLPYSDSSVFAGTGASNFADAELYHTFFNETEDAVTYQLRLEGYALVFQEVPEPSSLVLLALGGLLPLILRRRVACVRIASR